MIAQCRSSSLALGCSCKPWEALGTFFLWQGLDVQKVTHFECWMANMCSWLYMFATVLANLPQTKATVVNGPRNGMNGVQGLTGSFQCKLAQDKASDASSESHDHPSQSS